MSVLTLAAPRVFDGTRTHRDAALLLGDGLVEAVVRRADLPRDAEIVELRSGILAPGFVDLQVNGGGGVLLNEDRTVAAIERICAAHAPFGTTALLPTLITDRGEITGEAIDAAIAATEAKVEGFAGLHLEGPHLCVARKGAHDPALIRPMEEEDLAELLRAAAALPTLLSTVAVENVRPDQIRRMSEGGIVVSLGHTDADVGAAALAFRSGARMATHLFNAMSPLGHREPGMIGAVLDGGIYAGLIADGIHVHPATMALALRAQAEPGHIFLVTDAMSTVGTTLDRFSLNGREIIRRDGALRLTDGTLAGADLTMIEAVRIVHQTLALPLEEALRMASLYPAKAIGREREFGQFVAGADGSAVHLTEDLEVAGVWIRGRRAV